LATLEVDCSAAVDDSSVGERRNAVWIQLWWSCGEGL